MLNKVLETPVDFLVELIKKNNDCSISFLRDKMKISTEIIEKWLVVLEEYNVLEVHYKGLEGFVKIKEVENKIKDKNDIDIDSLKEKFILLSKKKKFSYSKMKELWPIFIFEHEGEIKKVFEQKAIKKKISGIKIEKAWGKYKKDLEVF